MRLFRRAGRVEVCVDGAVYKRRGAVFAVGRDRQNGTDDYRRCGSVPSPLYRYIGDAAELLAGGAAFRSIVGMTSLVFAWRTRRISAVSLAYIAWN